MILDLWNPAKIIHAFDTFVFRYKSHSATVHFQDYFINCCLREYPKIFNYTIIVNIMMGGHQAGPSVNPQPCAACWHTFPCTIWSDLLARAGFILTAGTLVRTSAVKSLIARFMSVTSLGRFIYCIGVLLCSQDYFT